MLKKRITVVVALVAIILATIPAPVLAGGPPQQSQIDWGLVGGWAVLGAAGGCFFGAFGGPLGCVVGGVAGASGMGIIVWYSQSGLP